MPPVGDKLPLRAVIFDVDGTLVDTWDLYVETYRRTLADFSGRLLSVEDVIALRPASEVRLFQAQVPDAHEAAHVRFLEHYDALHAKHVEGPYPGVAAMLDTLRAAGLRLGVVTGKSRGAWRITAGAIGLGEFAAVFADEDVRDGKPHPEGILAAVATLGVRPEEVVYVGDSPSDLAAARAAGVPFAGVLWPKGAGEIDAWRELVTTQGGEVFATPADLAEALATRMVGRDA
jgi:phosphoglycolate phosphatase/pyrophosphatase PpaX